LSNQVRNQYGAPCLISTHLTSHCSHCTTIRFLLCINSKMEPTYTHHLKGMHQIYLIGMHPSLSLSQLTWASEEVPLANPRRAFALLQVTDGETNRELPCHQAKNSINNIIECIVDNHSWMSPLLLLFIYCFSI